MGSAPNKGPRQRNPTAGFLAGDFDTDRQDSQDSQERFGDRSKHSQQRKIERTAQMREAENLAPDVESLPLGQVVQVFSLYAEVIHAGVARLCVVRKTLRKISGTAIVVGDWVRFREVPSAEAVIEQVQPRKTVLTRTDSFRSDQQQPIVANADQMLIVASLVHPRVKWGLVDRMIVAGKSGGLEPIVCLNKIDLAAGDPAAMEEAEAVLSHYATLGIRTLKTSAEALTGLAELAELLKDRTTVLAGHSGMGKSSLIGRMQAGLDIRVAPVSIATEKGRHTTTGARSYKLDIGGYVIDTPGVKVFGLWKVSKETLAEYYPDVAAGTAPPWRIASYERVAGSLAS